ncbi:MAG: nucleotidyltransferase family protein [gamma proteobacterium symbiont of Taylorina sp.]|nr:nucleotidyltransferase family protein [gamma proteobacterium symbiont of Taylorina sp.]
MITIDTLKNNKTKIQQILEQYHAENIRVFGSVARGDSTEESDIDLLVNFLPNASLFDQVGITDELSLLLDCPVDVVSERALNKHLLPVILNEAIAI